MTAVAACSLAMPALAQSSDELKTGVVSGPDWYNDNYPVSSYKTYTGCQTVYPASKMDAGIQAMDSYAVKKLIYPLSAQQSVPVSGKADVVISLGKTDETNISNWIPESELTVVYQGTIDLSDASVQTGKALEIMLDTEYVLSQGESLIVSWQANVTDKFSSHLYFGDPASTPGYHTKYYTSNTSAVSFEDLLASANLPGDISRDNTTYATTLTIGYTEATGGEEIFDAVIAPMQYYEDAFPVSSYRTYSGCQTVYPASRMSDNIKAVDAYSVKEIICPFSPEKPVPASGKAEISVYIGKCEDTNISGWIPESDLVQVFSGVVDLADPKVQADKAFTFPVDVDFVVNKDESLVVAWQTAVTEKFSSSLFFGNPESTNGTHSKYYQSNTSNVSFSDLLNGNTSGASTSSSPYVPSLNIRYALAQGGGNVGGGEIGDIVEKVILGGTYSTSEFPVCVQSWNLYSASQSLYPSELLDSKIKVDTYTVKELIYPMLTAPSDGKLKLTALIAKTDAQALSTALTEENFTVVASGVEIDFSAISDGALRIPLKRPYVMQKGESMVVALLAEIDEATRPTTYPAFISGNTGISGYHTMYRTGNEAPLGVSDVTLTSDFVGGLTMVYMIGEELIQQPDVTDLAVTSLTAPEGSFYTGKNYEFTVALQNNGTQNAENYTVEIVNADNNDVLATVSNPKTVLSLMSANVPVEVTFAAGGTYNLVARVTIEGDEVAENNQSEAVTVNVISLDYKAVSVNGNAVAVPEEEQTYSVTVANEGLSELSGYTVELYLLRENMDDVLLARSDENPAIAAGETADIEFKHTFELGGTYGLKALVYIEGGEPSETPQFDVTVTLDKLSPVISAQLPQWDGATFDFYGYAFERNYKFGASQLLYSADMFGEHANAYQIQSMALTVVKEEYSNDPFAVKIYMAQTDRTEAYVSGAVELVPEDEFVLVYDGVIAPTQSGDNQNVVLELQRLFTLENGKSLVLNVQTQSSEGTPVLLLAAANTDGYYQTYAHTNRNAENFSMYNCTENYANRNVLAMLPCITFGYALEPLPAKIDVAATELSVPAGEIKADEEVSFRVYFENVGTVDVEEYTIELVSFDENDEATVLQSYEGTRYLAVSQNANQSVKYTFENSGEYRIAARLVVEGDVDTENNQTPVQTVKVGASTGVGNLVADGTLSYDAAARVLNVNLGVCELTVSDLAGRTVAVYSLDGAAKLPVNLSAGIYVVSANGKTLKIRI